MRRDKQQYLLKLNSGYELAKVFLRHEFVIEIAFFVGRKHTVLSCVFFKASIEKALTPDWINPNQHNGRPLIRYSGAAIRINLNPSLYFPLIIQQDHRLENNGGKDITNVSIYHIGPIRHKRVHRNIHDIAQLQLPMFDSHHYGIDP